MTIEVVSAKSRYNAPLNNFFPFEKLKPRPNDRNMPTQHAATLLGTTCCVRLATVLRHVVTCLVLLAQIWPLSNLSQQHPTCRNTVAKRTQHVGLNSVVTCCIGMLRSFGRGLSFGGRQSNVSMKIVVFISCQFHSHFRLSLDQVYIAQLLWQSNLQFRWNGGLLRGETWSVFETHSRNTFYERNVCEGGVSIVRKQNYNRKWPSKEKFKETKDIK